MKHLPSGRSVVLALTLVFCSSGFAAAKIGGHSLHDAKCMKCHKTEVYTRKNRRIKSLAALKQRVNQCAVNTGTGWNPKQIDAVIDYLNTSFYKYSVFE
jgi:hypothetical protein